MSEPQKDRILFVDDENLVLQGYKRSLRAYRDRWEVSFALSGAEALAALESQEFDIIVSDMRMPAMDGATLLGEVAARFPVVARVALSGQSDQDMLMRSMLNTHQFLSKPCEPELLVGTLQLIASTRRKWKQTPVLAAVSGVATLPCNESTWEELAWLTSCSDASLDTIAHIVENDISMAAKTLQVANSAAIGLNQDIYSPRDAALKLGLDRFRALSGSAEWLVAPDALVNTRYDPEQICKHSGQSSRIARVIAARMGLSNPLIEASASAALLHSVGEIVFIQRYPEGYSKVIELVKAKEISTFEAELEVFGAHHAEAGALLLALWGIPQIIVDGVAHHHDFRRLKNNYKTPAGVLHVANFIERIRQRDARAINPKDLEIWNDFGISEDLEELIEIADKELIRAQAASEQIKLPNH